jgi:hypothetical protein
MPDTPTAAAPVELSPERQQLAAAQKRLSDWEIYVAHARSVGLAAIDQKRATAGRDLVAAKEVLQEAHNAANQPRAALARALGRAAGPTVAEAERSVSVAEDAYNAISHEYDLVRQEIERIDGQGGEVDRAKYAVKQGIAEILRAEGVIDRLMAERLELLTRANAIKSALRVIFFAIPASKEGAAQFDPAPGAYAPDNSISAPLAAAVEALGTNPGAALPEFPPELAPREAAAA